MAAADDGDSNIFVYLGGEQEVPADVTHVRIARSVKIILRRAFFRRRQLVSVETHDGIEKVEGEAFDGCISLRGIKLPGVREIGLDAFNNCGPPFSLMGEGGQSDFSSDKSNDNSSDDDDDDTTGKHPESYGTAVSNEITRRESGSGSPQY